MQSAESYEFLRDTRKEARRSATDRVTAALREAIVSMNLKPGEIIDKASICERLGVSRFPVSEALSRLQAEGLVEIRPQRGSTVTLIRLADARENMFLRKALETEAMRNLARRIEDDTLAELKRNHRYQKSAVAADDRAGFYTLDLEFHDILLDAVSFPRAKAVAESARLGLDRVRRLLASPRRIAVTLKEHGRIVAALEAGDADKATRAMEAHLDAVMEELQAFAEARPEHFSDRSGAVRSPRSSKRRRQ